MAKLLIFISLLMSLCAAKCDPSTRAKRRAWHNLTTCEKTAYLDAELCLMQKPAKLGLPGAKSRFDEFQATHQLQAFATHFVGAFLPFHRALLYAHEKALRNECGYDGWQPYWQEQLDAGHFYNSSIFDPDLGFGGDGSGPDHCITNGRFANYTNPIGPAYEYNNHCIDRQFNETLSALSSQADVDKCLNLQDWLSAWPCIEANPHLGGHAGVGGEMFNGVSSPGDPLFYLHHTWLDKMWADWQARDLPKRLTEMGGNNLQDEPNLNPLFPPRPPYIPQPTSAEGDPGNVTTLGHVLHMYGNGKNRTIGEVMDIWEGGPLCYEYVES